VSEEWRKVFKVISVLNGQRYSFNTANGYTSGPTAVIYEPDQVTMPEVGLLYAFKDEESALHFVGWAGRHSGRPIELWEADGVVAEGLRPLIWYNPFSMLEENWELFLKGGVPRDSELAPEGTVLCRKIRPRKRLYRWRKV